jgi:hypothetical protein
MACFLLLTLASSSFLFTAHALHVSAPTSSSSSSRILRRMECSLVDSSYGEQEEMDVPASSPIFASNDMDARRRDVLLRIRRVPPSAVAMAAALTTSISNPSRPALAISLPFITQKERRQLEVCLVAVLRITYWAQKLVLDLSISDSGTNTRSSSDIDVVLSREQIDQRQRLAYLEARLGAKAILTGKIGGGAAARVYDMAALKLVDCLADIDYYYYSSTMQTSSSSSSGGKATKTRATLQFSDLERDFYEALATLVEFDGYDTLTDASPRSTLLLQQCNAEKLVFVRRMLSERLVPLGNQIVHCFPPESIELSEFYVQKYYPNEVIPPPPTTTAATSANAAAEKEQIIL